MTGTPAQVIEAAEQWGEAVAIVDRQFACPTVADRHQRQIARLVETIKAYADRVEPHYHIVCQASGHADVETVDESKVYLDSFLPVPHTPRSTIITARVVDPDPEC